MGEVSRVLREDGEAVFYEPLGHNPLINLYRRRTPDLRSEDEHPLTMADLDSLRTRFDTVELEFFALLSLAATPIAGTKVGRVVRRVLEQVDAAIFRLVPPARSWAWIVVIRLRGPRR
jgi:hypothetical protein